MPITPLPSLQLRRVNIPAASNSTAINETASQIEVLSAGMGYARGILSTSFTFDSGKKEGAVLERWLRSLPGIFIAPLPEKTPDNGAVMLKEVRGKKLDGPQLFSTLVTVDRLPDKGIFTRPFEWRFSNTIYRGILRLQRQNGGFLLTFELNLAKAEEDDKGNLRPIHPSDRDLDALRYAWAYALSRASTELVAAAASKSENGSAYRDGLLPQDELALVASVRRGGTLALPASPGRTAAFLAGSRSSLSALRGVASHSGFSLSALVDRVCEQIGISLPATLPMPRASVDAMAADKGIDPSILYYHINRMTLPGIDPSWTEGDKETYVDSPYWINVLRQLGEGGPCSVMDVRKLLVRAWFNPNRPREKFNSSCFERGTLIPFVLGRSTPNLEALRHLAEFGGISLKDLYAFVMEVRFPELRPFLQRWKKENEVFHINPRNDESYLRTVLAKPATLGFFLWLHRKCLGLDPREMAERCRFAPATYRSLEKDSYSQPLSIPDAHKLAEVTGVPFAAIRELAKETYPGKTERDSGRWQVKKGTFKGILLHAMRGKPTEQVVDEMRQTWLEATGLEAGTTPQIVRVMLDIPNRGVAGEHLAAFFLTHQDQLDPHLFWRMDRRILTVPVGTTLDDVLGFSLSHFLLATRLRLGLSRKEWATRADFFSHQFLAHRESVVRSGMEEADIVSTSELLGMDPRILRLASYPWPLLAFPLKDSNGKVLSRPDDPELPYRLAQHGIGRFTRHLQLRSVINSLDLPPELRKRMGEYAILNDEELLILALRLDPIQRFYLAEAFRQGELFYFMGRDAQGEVDWSLPEGWEAQAIQALDVVQMAHAIRSNYRWWATALGYSSTIRFEEAVTRGLSVEQMERLVSTMQAHGFAHIPQKVFYLRLRGDFLANFVDWKSGITERPEVSRRLDGVGLGRTLDKRSYGPVRVKYREVIRRLNAAERHELLSHSAGHDRHAINRFLSEAQGRYFPAVSPVMGVSVAMTEAISVIAGG